MSDIPQPDQAPEEKGRLERDADLLGRKDSAVRKWLFSRIEACVRGFEEQAARSEDLDDWWDIYNCELGRKQFYNGNACVFVPLIRDAINARVTRHSNQLFPQSGKFIDSTATDGKPAREIEALINHYIREMKLQTQVINPLLRNGDIEGQLNLYLDWNEVRREIVSRETHGVTDQSGVELPGSDIEDLRTEEVIEGVPAAQVLHDADVLVIPATVDTIEQAFAAGGSVTIVRRWSKEKLKRMMRAGEIDEGGEEDAGNRSIDSSMTGLSDLPKKLARDVGIKAKGPHILMFETWLMVPLSERGSFSEKGEQRLCRLWWDLERNPRGLKRNPYWNDRCPLLSEPAEKVPGVFKGKSKVEPLSPLQYEANDAANERADVDHFGAMPIIRRTPGQGNAPLILNLAAIWDAGPGDIEFLAFPDLSQRARTRILDAMQIINAALSVTPSMLTQQTGRPGAKRNQAEIAMEQQIELLSVAEAVKIPEQGILTPMVQWMVDLDHQFRDRTLTVRRFGELGVMAEMIDVPVLQNRAHYWFSWCGAEQARLNVAMQQQGTALLGVALQAGQQLQQEGFQLKIGPAFERAFSNVFGPMTGSAMLVDQRHQLSMPPDQENGLLMSGFAAVVHPLDNDQEHILSHSQAMQQMGDLHGTFRVHIEQHLIQARGKAAAMVMQAMQQASQPGALPSPGPGGGGGRPLRPSPPGAQPAGPRPNGKGPPGMIRPDNLPGAGALTMPRRQ